MSRTNPRYHRNNPLGTPILPGNGTVRYAIQGAIEGQMTINTFEFVSTTFSPTHTQMNTLLAALSAGLFADYKALVSADWTCTRELLNCTHLNSVAGVQSTSNAGATGGRAAGHEPTEVAQPVNRITNLKGQHGRGRFSIPAIATADVTASKITAAGWITALTTFFTALSSPYSDGSNNWTHCVTSRAPTPPKLATWFAPTQTYVMSPLLGTIRRRKIGRGK